MRKIIAALQVSLDGFIEGPDGALDWVESWDDGFDILPRIDACILGAGMYPGYEQYWRAILADPAGVLPLADRPPSPGEITYAGFADRTPHYVLSRTLSTLAWKTAQVVRDLDAIRALKTQPGKDMHAVGGAALIGSLMNAGLVDEVQLVQHPIILGGGKALFGDVQGRHALRFLGAEPRPGGLLRVRYAVAQSVMT